MHSITKKIKIAAIDRGLDNSELAELLGYKTQYLSMLINGSTGFPLAFLVKVSHKLDLDLNELIELKENENITKTK